MTATKTARGSAQRATRASQPDALELLIADHEEVSKLFKKFERAKEESEKEEIVQMVCQELTIHATIEEEIFYPAVRREVKAVEELLDEAQVEHGTVKEYVSQLEAAMPGDELYDAKVTVLGEYVKHHVKEEQEELFPKVRKSKLDLEALGERLASRKAELKGE
jgi:hemerythrin superfamily protein